jgi:hypothetical protein
MAIQMKIKVVKTNKHTVNFSMFIVLLFRNKRVLSVDEENIFKSNKYWFARRLFDPIKSLVEYYQDGTALGILSLESNTS